MVGENEKAIKSIWIGKCNIYEYEENINKYGVTEHNLVEKYSDILCRISFSKITQAIQNEFSIINQVIKLFVGVDVEINAGSIIEVTQNNITRKYKHSGVSAVYTNHQEIILELYNEVA